MDVFVTYKQNLRYMKTASWNGIKEIRQRKRGFFPTVRKRVTNFEFRELAVDMMWKHGSLTRTMPPYTKGSWTEITFRMTALIIAYKIQLCKNQLIYSHDRDNIVFQYNLTIQFDEMILLYYCSAVINIGV